ncbi:MAG: 3D domain-containing protein [Acidobacteria bacterium]|nr:3D domain-containing protein [Acidobacteriota bacterium]
MTVVAAGAFVSLYEVTALDSRYAARQAARREATALPSPGARLAFDATAYCKGVTTASGVPAQRGVAASDPALLPTGSVVDVEAGDPRYDGIYTVMDTGPAVQGRELDLYMWSCYEALEFGRRPVRITVLRLGWNPNATSPTLLERIFRKPAAIPAASASTRDPAMTATSGSTRPDTTTSAAAPASPR